MKAYVELIQRREREIGCDVLTHQKVCVLCASPAATTSNAVLVVERCRLCRQLDEDCHRRYLVDGCHGFRCHRVAVRRRPKAKVVKCLTPENGGPGALEGSCMTRGLVL